MTPLRQTTLQRLRRNQFISYRRPHALCLRAERGTLWVTVDGELADIELEPGQRRVFDGPATVLVGTLHGPAVFSATPLAPPAGWAQRLLGWLQQSPARLGWAR